MGGVEPAEQQPAAGDPAANPAVEQQRTLIEGFGHLFESAIIWKKIKIRTNLSAPWIPIYAQLCFISPSCS